MKNYWDNCCLIVFTGIRTGINSSPDTYPSIRQRVEELLPDARIHVEIAPHFAHANAQEWPKKMVDTVMEKFILSVYRSAFELGYRKIAGIFSFPETLKKKHLEEAFLSIRPFDFCLGPDHQGGLYFLGMSLLEERVITGQPWGEASISKSITREIGSMKKIMYKLPLV